ncbi:hypothetical protein DMA11_13915 [Marinilabiliaceae bacterium JC017]|nr:hypothetical protein DMA11_13915 [Marinilabiliaceae bacterium JC017]
MKEIITVLNGCFKILRIIIQNFTTLNDDLLIEIEIYSKDLGQKRIKFINVSKIDIHSEYYTCSDKSSIIIEDLSTAQIEGIRYKVLISEDVMTFYCKEIIMN